MTIWEPATEAEAAMRDALRANDQELYFRILARGELLLPVSADALPGHASTGWGTWTTGGRTHVLAFTSETALRACLAGSAGPTRRVSYSELAASWPNLDWWLAINPGLPIEGYLPAWFVSQLARGDVRLPGRSLGARARLERAETAARARATAAVPGRTFPPSGGQPAAMPAQTVPGEAGAGQPAPAPANRPAPPRSPLAGRPESGDPSRPAAAPRTRPAAEGTRAAGNQVAAHQPGSGPANPAVPTGPGGPGGLPRRPVPAGPASLSAGGDLPVPRPDIAGPLTQPPADPASLWRLASGDARVRRSLGRAGQVSTPADSAPGGGDDRAATAGVSPADAPPASWYAAAERRATRQTGAEPALPPEPVDRGPASGPPVYAPAPAAPVIPGVDPAGSVGPAGAIAEARLGGVERAGREPAARERTESVATPTSGPGQLPGPQRSHPPIATARSDSGEPEAASGAATAVEGPRPGRLPSPQPSIDEPTPTDSGANFTPANEVEENLLSAASGGSTDSFLSTLLLARVLLPVAAASAAGARPGDDGFTWRTETLDGETYVVVFTSEDRLADHLADRVETVNVKFVQLIRHWPDNTWSFAINPGTPVGAKLPGPQIVALASWAADVGLGDDAGGSEPVEPPSPEPSPQPTYASTREEPGHPTMMQKTIAPSQVGYYLERGYDRVSGFVHRASEVAHLTTPAKLYAALGLGYPGSPFSRDAEDVYVVRWPAYRPSLYRIPYGGQHEAAMRAMEGWVIERAPFRGNGFAPGDSSDVVAEFKVDSVRLPHGSQLWRLQADGTETKVATLDSDGPTWRPTGED